MRFATRVSCLSNNQIILCVEICRYVFAKNHFGLDSNFFQSFYDTQFLSFIKSPFKVSLFINQQQNVVTNMSLEWAEQSFQGLFSICFIFTIVSYSISLTFCAFIGICIINEENNQRHQNIQLASLCFYIACFEPKNYSLKQKYMPTSFNFSLLY